jgi:hypothetical protein
VDPEWRDLFEVLIEIGHRSWGIAPTFDWIFGFASARNDSEGRSVLLKDWWLNFALVGVFTNKHLHTGRK